VTLSLAQFNSATNSGATTQNVTVTATLAGDFLVIVGMSDSSVTCNSITTNQGDTGVFQNSGGSTTPLFITSPGALTYYISIIAATAGTTTVTAHYSAAPGFDDLGVYVVRGATTLTLDQSVVINNTGTPSLAVSGLTGTLATAIEFAVGYTVQANGASSQNTGQTGSAGFTQDGINGNGSGFQHQITSATTALQSAWNTVAGAEVTMCATFFDSGGGDVLMAQVWM
jgi:hypothetical protein